jgi:hypothetical protein
MKRDVTLPTITYNCFIAKDVPKFKVSVFILFHVAITFHSVRSNPSCRFMSSKADMLLYEMKLLSSAHEYLYVNIMLIINPVAGFYSILLSLQKVL